MSEMLLTRDNFRESVFKRDSYKCIVCGDKAIDAHHILERRLFKETDELGGYFLSNGASVCEKHHIDCETTEISVEDIRYACNITKPRIPNHLYPDQIYDKWGNPVLVNGTRLKGELFNDESVQKILKIGNKLELFTNLVKYPRTYHVPWSLSKTSDDRSLVNMDNFIGERVIVTVKMDGENTSLYNNYIHARSLDGRNHTSRDWVKGFWANIMGDIPEDWRICGENLYAKHSIHYNNLLSYFLGFSIWNDSNICLDWDSTIEWFSLLNISAVDILYDGIYDETIIKKLWTIKDWDSSEGYVIRLADSFHYKDFNKNVVKFVRSNHIHTHGKNWSTDAIIQNKLK